MKRIMGMRRHVMSLGLICAVAACAIVGPDYKTPDTLQANQSPQPFVEIHEGFSAGTEPPQRWWTLFNDVQLNVIVDEAVRSNTDIRIALANLERAKAVVNETTGGLWPATSIDASITQGVASAAAQNRTVPLKAARTYDAGFSLAYDPDLFGRLRRAVEASEADADAIAANYDLALINVIANTTRAYGDACSAGRQIEVAEKSLNMQMKSFQLTRRNVEAGRGTQLDLSRAKSQLAQIRASIPALRAQQKNALFRLASLMGREPGKYPREVEDCKTPLTAQRTLPVGDGMSLLRRRPDIRAAERRLAATTASIGVATAGLYPSISFGASVGTAGHHLANLDEQPAYRWSLGPLVRWSFPNTALARARIEQSKASQKAALATFDGTILNALRDVETALSAYALELERNSELRQARDLGDDAANSARKLFQAGAGSFLDVLDAERNLVSADASLAASDATLASYRVNLYLALGGGWSTAQSSDRNSRN
jgi:NodT family efflux transporter outer membrane factor (OMF) lipoprotein